MKGPYKIGKNKIVIGLIKDELGGNVMIKFVGLRAKNYSYLTVVKIEKLKFENVNLKIIKYVYKQLNFRIK